MRRFARLRDFGHDATFVTHDGVGRLASCLHEADPTGKLGLIVCHERSTTGYLIDMDSGKIKTVDSERKVRSAGCTFVVWLSEAALRDILRGALSPLDALVGKRLRYAGSEDAGIAIFRAIATNPSDILAPCREV